MKFLRMIFIFLLFIYIVYWGFFDKSTLSQVGLINDVLSGFVLFAALGLNCAASILDLGKKDYGTLPNRITMASVAILLIYFGLPSLLTLASTFR